jgi:hypothetical protein
MERIVENIQDRRMFFYVIVSIALSGYDAMATVQHISRGVASEGNPLMDPLVHMNAVTFFTVKILITALCLAVCYSYSHLRTARFGIQVVTVIYSILCIYHMLITVFI